MSISHALVAVMLWWLPGLPPPVQVASSSPQLVIWTPRDLDVGDSSTEDNKRLAAILEYSRDRKYKIQANDTLDKVIRTNFLVYSSNHPNAYELYKQEILRRNSSELSALDPKTLWLREGGTLTLPAGPRFTVSNFGPLAYLARRDLRDSQKIWTQANRTQRVAFSFSRCTLTELGCTNQSAEVPGRIPPGFIIDPEQYANFVSEVIELEPSARYDLRVPDTASRSLPALADVQVNCDMPCTPLTEILGTSAARSTMVLVADSGFDPAAGRRNLDPEFAIGAPQAILDVSPNRHGTFIYTQIVGHGGDQSEGVLRRDRVFVSNVASTSKDVCGSPMADPWCFDLMLLDQVSGSFWGIVKSKRSPKTGIVNLSAWGGYGGIGFNLPTRLDGHLLFVVAAGNDGESQTSVLRERIQRFLFTAINGYESNLLVVGATDPQGMRAKYSNYHDSKVDIFAPGSCVCGAGSKQLNGTSQATPVVAAAAAILAADFPTWRPIDIKLRLIATSDYLDDLNGKGVGGQLNLKRARKKDAIVIFDDGGGITEADIRKIRLSSRFESEFSIAGRKVLRLHKVLCENDPGRICFDRISDKSREVSGFRVLSTEIIEFEQGGLRRRLTADRIRDIILPSNYEVEGGWLTVDED